MSLSKLWKWYERLILNYTDINKNFKLFIGSILCIVPSLILNYFIYIIIFNFNNEYKYALLIFLSIAEGRLLLMFIMWKNKCNFGKGQNKFVLLISLCMLIASILGLTYLIIKDINGGFPKKEPQSYTKEINPNLLNNPNKYDYLKVK